MADKNIFQRMLAIESELSTIAKNLTVSTGKSNSYKAVSERDVIDNVKPIEAKHGVYSYPLEREVIESNILESESTYNGNTTKKSTFMTRIKTVYRFVNVDSPNEYVDTVVFSEGIDSQDKGSGKAMTYADKYALMKMYKISTGDDADATASVDTHYTKTKPTNKKYVCDSCGSLIKDANGATAEAIAMATHKKYGRCLCYNCITKQNEEAKKNVETMKDSGIPVEVHE